ncbi:MAG: hypothetical protein ACR2NR_10100 [Solirubrobacteraceae bacterium]
MPTDNAVDGLRRGQPELAGQMFDCRRPGRLFGLGVGARLSSALRAGTLDRALADGGDPARSPRLAARAAHLTRRATRTRLASNLEALLGRLDAPLRRAQVRPSRAAITANRGQLMAVAAALRGAEPVYARGVAELSLMLRDGTGPVYCDRHGEALARQLQLIRASLRG